MKSPLLTALFLSAAVVLAGFALPLVWRGAGDPAPAPTLPAAGAGPAAPWNITLDQASPGASTVFGLRLPGSTLADVHRRWGEDVVFAVVSSPGTPPALEGHIERFSAAGVNGRLVLVFEAPADDLARWQAQAPGTPTGTGARRHPLDATRAPEATRTAPLTGLSFLPSARLDGPTVESRFGAPDARRVDEQGTEYWIYPRQGLVIALPRQGKAVLQYVAPQDHEQRLAAPLKGLPNPSAASPAAARP